MRSANRFVYGLGEEKKILEIGDYGFFEHIGYFGKKKKYPKKSKCYVKMALVQDKKYIPTNQVLIDPRELVIQISRIYPHLFEKEEIEKIVAEGEKRNNDEDNHG